MTITSPWFRKVSENLFVLVDEGNCVVIEVGIKPEDRMRVTVTNIDDLVLALKEAREEVWYRETWEKKPRRVIRRKRKD